MTVNSWRYVKLIAAPNEEEGNAEAEDGSLLSLIEDCEWEQVLERLSCLWATVDTLKSPFFPPKLVPFNPELFATVQKEFCQTDEEGNTVLHAAIDNQAPLAVIRSLLLTNPLLGFDELCALLEEDPSVEEGSVPLASVTNNQDDTALHRATFCCSDVTLIELIVMAYPAAAKRKNHDAKSPIFYAGSKESPMSAVANFLDDATTEGETDDEVSDDAFVSPEETLVELPRGQRIKALLDDVAGVETTKDTSRPTRLITSLCKYCPAAIEVRDSYNCNILHFAIMDGVDIDCVRLICQLSPRACRVQNRFGCTPLQAAARMKATFEVVKLLCSHFPDAASIPNNMLYVPFTRCIQMKHDMDYLEFLLGLYPAAPVFCNKKGLNAFDMLDIAHSARHTVLPFLQDPTAREEVLPEGIVDWWTRADLMLKLYRPQNSLERSPPVGSSYKALHAALAVNSTRTLVEYCLWQFPDDVAIPDHRGRLPLHIAAATGAHHGPGINPDDAQAVAADEANHEEESIVLTLLDLYPQAAHTQDATGRLPLHSLLEGATCIDSVAFHALLQANPDALEKPVVVRQHDGGGGESNSSYRWLPFQMAARSNAANTGGSNMLQNYDITSVKNSTQIPSTMNQLDVIFELLRAAPSGIVI